MSDTGSTKKIPELSLCGKIGGTAYIVKGYFRKDAREDMASKLRRVILSRKFPA